MGEIIAPEYSVPASFTFGEKELAFQLSLPNTAIIRIQAPAPMEVDALKGDHAKSEVKLKIVRPIQRGDVIVGNINVFTTDQMFPFFNMPLKVSIASNIIAAIASVADNLVTVQSSKDEALSFQAFDSAGLQIEFQYLRADGVHKLIFKQLYFLARFQATKSCHARFKLACRMARL